MSKKKIYLAGPFFNDAQRKIIRDLEYVLDADYEVWSPSRDGVALPPDASDEEQKRVFEANYHHIKDCDIMVAVVEPNDDRPIQCAIDAGKDLFCNGELYAYGGVPADNPEDFSDFGGVDFLKEQVWPQYPDIGTVWEMGVAYEQGKAIVMFATNEQRRPNLMLAKSCRGVAIGLKRLVEVLEIVVSGGNVEYKGEIT